MTSLPERGAAAPSGVLTLSQSIKQEPGTSTTMEGAHSHQFGVRVDPDKAEHINITCTRPCTVLEAIKSDTRCRKIYEKKNYSDSTIKIQIGKGSKEFVIATHFPCCKIPDNELLILRNHKPHGHKQEECEEKTYRKGPLSPDQYISFYIDTKGGHNALCQQLFTDNTLTKFTFLWVCEERGITVKEALDRDGRFVDLGNFFLTDNDNGDSTFSSDQPISALEGKKLKISYGRGQADREETPPKAQSEGKRSKKKGQRAAAEAEQTDEFQDKSKANSHSSDTPLEEIYQILCEQFSDLKQWMESRFPGDSLPKALKLRQENFGKIRQAFAEVYRLRQLIERGRSVCKITVESKENKKVLCRGTGFVLVGRYVLTNAHLFTKSVDENEKLRRHLKVSATFDDESHEQEPRQVIPVKDVAAYCKWAKSDYFDYAVLELEAGATAVPPGLLGDLGPAPEDEDENAGACIIGHPGGGVKKLDITWVIKEKDRGENAGSQVTGDITMIIEKALVLEKQKIERILPEGDRADRVVTYNTFMYHGSSGSPVFDAKGKVFGLHTYGYGFEDQQNHGESTVIVCAQRLDNILKDLRSKGSELWPSIEEQLSPEMKRQLGLTTQ